MPIGPYNVLSGPYAQKLNQTMRQLWGQGDGPPQTKRRESLFFLIRPVQLTTGWTETDAGPYKASAKFIALNINKNYVIQNDPTIEIYSPTDLSEEPNSASGDCGWVIYRGRWELVTGGGTAEGGHLTGMTSSAITGPGSETTVAGKTVTCPLLKSSETIASGTKVIISRNQSSGNWQIIEAQCPSGS